MNFSRASSAPAATICPPPLELAATSCAALIASRTSSSSPPRTAAIPVGDAAAAWAMPVARTRIKRIASSSLRIPESAAAVISPTECPAKSRFSDPRRASVRRPVTIPAATIKGWAIAVSLIASSSASVP